MKVALILVGYMRNWEDNLQYIRKQILETYDVDVYISSYNYSKWFWNSDSEKVDIQKIIDVYNPKKFIFRSEETCPSINFKENNSESLGREYSYRQLYGWYTHRLALDLFNFDAYNIIIKLRTDVGFSNLNLDVKNKLVIPAWKYHPGPCSPEESYVDYLAYGPPKYMKGYFQLFDKLELMQNNQVDISLGETLLKHYIDTYVTKNVYEDPRIDWILRGEMWASEKSKYFPIKSPTIVKDE